MRSTPAPLVAQLETSWSAAAAMMLLVRIARALSQAVVDATRAILVPGEVELSVEASLVERRHREAALRVI